MPITPMLKSFPVTVYSKALEDTLVITGTATTRRGVFCYVVDGKAYGYTLPISVQGVDACLRDGRYVIMPDKNAPVTTHHQYYSMKFEGSIHGFVVSAGADGKPNPATLQEYIEQYGPVTSVTLVSITTTKELIFTQEKAVTVYEP